MLKKQVRIVQNKLNTIQELYNKIFIYEKDLPLELIGENWADDTITDLALLVGFNPWKRDVVSHYLKGYKTAFLKGIPNAEKLYRLEKTFISKIPNKQLTVFVWGRKDERKIFKRYLKLLKIRRPFLKICYVEDGFLRSINASVLHSRPASLCFDFGGNHFENKQTDLEELLNTVKLSPTDYREAQQLLRFFSDVRLTKYFNPHAFDNKSSFENLENVDPKETVLVIGQVESDASIVYGDSKIRTNFDLVYNAKKENKDKRILFRPHPDDFAKNNGSKLKKIQQIAEVLDPNYSLHDSFGLSNTVYVISSLSGFEALIYGKRVVVFGTPFYSNWGLTDDRIKIERRTAKLDIETLFKTVYDIYPQYISPVANIKSSFVDIASYFIVNTHLRGNIFNLVEDELFIKARKYSEILSLDFNVLEYLVDTRYHGEADYEYFESLINKFCDNDVLMYFEHISIMLANTSNYDLLKLYVNRVISILTTIIDSSSRLDNLLLEKTFYTIQYAQADANGRIYHSLPDCTAYFDNRCIGASNLVNLVINYAHVLSNNLQYLELENLIDWLNKRTETFNYKLNSIDSLQTSINDTYSKEITPLIYKRLTTLLQSPPTRSERDSNYRMLLISDAAKSYKSFLDKKYCSNGDLLLNDVLFLSLLGNFGDTSKHFRKFIDYFEIKKAEKDYHGNLALYSFSKRRYSGLIELGLLFVKNYFFEQAKIIIGILHKIQLTNNSQFGLLQLSYTRGIKGLVPAIEKYKKLSLDLQRNQSAKQLYAKCCRELGYFQESKQVYLELIESSKSLARQKSLNLELDSINFSQETSNYINSIEQPRFPKGVIFGAFQKDYNTLAMMTPAIIQLKKNGYAFVNLTAGIIEPHQSTGISYIDQLSSFIPLDMHDGKRHFDWYIDWEKKEISALDINFYHGFYEWLSQYTRRYYVDPDITMQAKRLFQTQILRADFALRAIDRIFNNVVSNGIPSIILSGSTHAPPYSIIRDYCLEKNHPLLSFIHCNVAYESYFTNLGSKFANTMCVTDMTLYPEHRAPFLARRDQFERWYKENSDNSEFLDKANNIINTNRVGSLTNETEEKVITFIKEQKELGKKIICAFGKVPVDLCVPYDGGPAHKDMADWITHTVTVCNNSEDIILLVKPHPHELRPEIALDLVEGFGDLIKTEVGNNIRILGHKDINGHALAPYLDLALLYNGSSGLELAAQGIPVMMASYFGRFDYPVDLLYPQNRDHYAEFILNLDYPVPNDETRKKAAFLMCYMGTDEIAILNQYSLRPVTNDKVGIPKWRKSKLEKFLREGDKNMRVVAKRITEKAEKSLSG